jgi:dipeptidyl aminopeptidase/acylaminoacyl peptidase
MRHINLRRENVLLQSWPRAIHFLIAFSIVSVGTFASSTSAADEDLGRTVALMARIGSSSSPSFSPDGKRIAFVSNLNGMPQVWTISVEGGFPQLVTGGDEPVGFVSWSPDGAWLAFNVAPGGGFNEQIYIVRPDGTGLRRLTEGGKENNFLGDWTTDGRFLTFSSNRRNPSSTDSYLIEVATGQLKMVAENRGTGGINDVSRDGKFGVLSRLINRGDNNLFLINLASGSEAILTPHQGPGTYFGGDFSPDGRVIYLGSNKDRDMLAFAKVRLGKDDSPGPIEILLARDDAELSNYAINEQGTIAALIWNVAGRSELVFLDLTTGKSAPAVELPAEIAFGVQFSKDGRRLALVASGAAAPPDVWVMDVAGRKFSQLTHSPHAGVALGRLVRPELVRYPAHDGLELSGWLYVARDAKKPGPIVLSFHGGPEGQERPAFNSTYQALLAKGISVFAPNVRGSSGFGKKFVNLDNGPLRVNGVKDIKASVEYVVKSGIADPRRIGIMGGSYGGYMVAAGLTEYPDLFAAGADLFGVVNFETFFKNTQPWMAAISKVEYGDPDTQAEMLRQLSPIHRVDQIKAPTIVLHGANDTNVPVIEAEQVVTSLKQRGVPVEYVLFPDEGHGWRKIPNRIRSTVEIVGWFDKYLNTN